MSRYEVLNQLRAITRSILLTIIIAGNSGCKAQQNITTLYVAASSVHQHGELYTSEASLFLPEGGHWSAGNSVSSIGQFILISFLPSTVSMEYDPKKVKEKPFLEFKHMNIDEIRVNVLPKHLSSLKNIKKITMEVMNYDQPQTFHFKDNAPYARETCNTMSMEPDLTGSQFTIKLPEAYQINIGAMKMILADLHDKSLKLPVTLTSINFYYRGKQLDIATKAIKHVYDSTDLSDFKSHYEYSYRGKLLRKSDETSTYAIFREGQLDLVKLTETDGKLTMQSKESIKIEVKNNVMHYDEGKGLSPLDSEIHFSSSNCMHMIYDEVTIVLNNSKFRGKYSEIPTHPHKDVDRIWAAIR